MHTTHEHVQLPGCTCITHTHQPDGIRDEVEEVRPLCWHGCGGVGHASSGRCNTQGTSLQENAKQVSVMQPSCHLCLTAVPAHAHGMRTHEVLATEGSSIAPCTSSLPPAEAAADAVTHLLCTGVAMMLLQAHKPTINQLYGGGTPQPRNSIVLPILGGLQTLLVSCCLWPGWLLPHSHHTQRTLERSTLLRPGDKLSALTQVRAFSSCLLWCGLDVIALGFFGSATAGSAE